MNMADLIKNFNGSIGGGSTDYPWITSNDLIIAKAASPTPFIEQQAAKPSRGPFGQERPPRTIDRDEPDQPERAVNQQDTQQNQTNANKTKSTPRKLEDREIKDAAAESQQRQESSFEIHATPRTPQTQKSVYALLSEEVDWKELSDVEKQVGDFLQDSQIHLDHALYAATRAKELQLLDTVYQEVSHIDQKLGKFEYEIFQCLQDIMDEYLGKAINDLAKYIKEKARKETMKDEPNYQIVDDDELSQYINDMNR